MVKKTVRILKILNEYVIIQYSNTNNVESQYNIENIIFFFKILKSEMDMPKANNHKNSATLVVGQNIKLLRTLNNLTLDDVSQGTGLSTSFISLVENGKSDIALARLQKIAEFFEINAVDLFSPVLPQFKRVISLEEAPEVVSTSEGITTYLLSVDPSRKMDPFYMVLEPGAGYDEPSVHQGEEFIFVIAGKLRVSLFSQQGNAPEEYTLNPNDTIYYASEIPHSYKNVGDGEVILIGSTNHRPVPNLRLVGNQ